MLNGLDLFSGIGGISYALREYVRPVAYCEIDPYCQAVLLSRMASGDIGKAPICTDIRDLQIPFALHSCIDIIYGGFPCQDISVAGHGKGLEGERSGLYWEIHRLAKEIKPKFIFLENVPCISSRGAWNVAASLTEIGYDCRWTTLSAQESGAPHKRERWWLLARSNMDKAASDSASMRFEQRPRKGIYSEWQAIEYEESSDNSGPILNYWQETEPPLCGVDDGPPHRVERIKCLGNGVVPQCAKKAFKYLMGLS